MSRGAKKWTKKDLGTLRSQIDSFCLYNRMYYRGEDIRRVVGEKRHEITLGGLRGWREMLLERRDGHTGYAKTAAHWATGVCGNAPDIVARFERLTIECTKDIEKVSQILARVADGLPEEVSDYFPDWLRDGVHKP